MQVGIADIVVIQIFLGRPQVIFPLVGGGADTLHIALFDKGIDKILKKVGEEATEIVIAAKNPDPEEVKYEISDFLYHMMVLMAEKGVSWEEITEELANR